MRVVLDNNILARAPAGPDGPAGELLARLQPPHLLIISSVMLQELSEVLFYERVRRIHGLDDSAIQDYLQHIQAAALVVTLPTQGIPRVVPHDEDDDVVIATAVAAQAEVIGTRDRHLLHPDVIAYCSQRGIEIVGDVQLLERLRSG